MRGKHERKEAFSKTLLRQDSLLIWIITISYIVLAFYCVHKGFTASLPWLTALPSVAWGAYAVSQNAYYKKSTAENTKDGIVFESTMNPPSNVDRDC